MNLMFKSTIWRLVVSTDSLEQNQRLTVCRKTTKPFRNRWRPCERKWGVAVGRQVRVGRRGMVLRSQITDKTDQMTGPGPQKMHPVFSPAILRHPGFRKRPHIRLTLALVDLMMTTQMQSIHIPQTTTTIHVLSLSFQERLLKLDEISHARTR